MKILFREWTYQVLLGSGLGHQKSADFKKVGLPDPNQSK
jgi:hypothetical protein